MAGISSNRKVARAARTAGGRRRNANTSVGWYSLIAVITIVGASLVTFSRQERLDASNPGSTPPLAPAVDADGTVTREGDNWYEAFGMYICDKYAPNINNEANPYGIFTANDGVIHISPFEKKYAGTNATVDLFAKAVDLKVDRNSFEVPGDPKVYKAGEKCGDKDGKFVIKEWTNATDAASGKEVKSNPTSVRLQNNYALALAFIPNDMKWEDIPLPESASKLAQIAEAEAASNQAAPTEQPTVEGEQVLPEVPAPDAANPTPPVTPAP